MIRVFVVDDEAPARDRMRLLLAGVPDVEMVGEAANGEQAIEGISRLGPDLVLLDIQMRGINGLEVAACLPRPRPKIIFCTAFEQYAVDAFELHAVDYLLKPVNRVRLAHAIARIRTTAASDADADLDRITEAARGKCTRLLARCGDRIRIKGERGRTTRNSRSI